MKSTPSAARSVLNKETARTNVISRRRGEKKESLLVSFEGSDDTDDDDEGDGYT